MKKKRNKEHHTLSFQCFTNRFNILMFFVLFFHGVCKISNFNLWTAKHLVQASCTELTLNRQDCKAKFSLATNFAFPALRAWYMCKTLHKVISPYGPHDKICNSKWLKKLFFMEVWFFSDFIILWQQKNAANLLSRIWLQRLKRQTFFLIILAIEPT